MTFTFQHRRGTAAAWATKNPVLASGEPALETDTGKEKIGDGATAWSSLPYKGGSMSDAALAAAVNTGTTKAALSATYDLGALKVIHVAEAGLDTNSGLIASQPKKTLAAALTAMGTASRGIIRAGLGVIDAGPTGSFSGYRCVLQGMGEGTIVRATAQTGPVIDLSGWLAPNNTQTTVEFRDFAIEGDNTAGVAKKGLRTRAAGEGGFSGVTLRNITASKTGGTPFDYTGAQLCTFDNLVASQPVSANANNVPYHYALGATCGNRFIGLGLRAITGSTVLEGAGGCLLFEADASYAPLYNVFVAPWFEYLHLPTNGSLIRLKGSHNHIADPQWFDSGKDAAATGTCCVRLSTFTPENYGGNRVTGYLPGTTGGTSIDRGVVVEQSGNMIDVTRGYGTNIVELAAGVARTHVMFRGSESIPSGAGWVDNSGTTTNLIIEAWNGAFQIALGVLKIGSNGLALIQNGYVIESAGDFRVAGVSAIGASIDGAVQLKVTSATIAREGLVVSPFSVGQTADLAGFNNGSGARVTSVLPFGTLIADDSTKGLVIKDTNGNYYRYTSVAGVLTATSLGATRPTS